MARSAETPNQTPHPKIWAASLSDYNAGRLHGDWFDAAVDPDELAKNIQHMLDASPMPDAEEWAIHDHEGFGPWRPNEYEDLDTLTRVAKAITEHGPDLAQWLAYLGQTEQDDIDQFQDAYQGRFNTLNDYAEHVIDQVNPTWTVDPPSWSHYVKVDTDQLARDLEIEHYIVNNSDGTITVFDPNVI